MHIVRFVAAVAVLRGVAELDARVMATVTLRFGVVTNQRKIRAVMIEAQPVELYDVGIASFVVGMTYEAGAAAGSPVAAMETKIHLYVSRDVLMTAQAQRTLFTAIECLVAGVAVSLEFRVPLDNLARHDQGLDLGISGSRNESKRDHRDTG